MAKKSPTAADETAVDSVVINSPAPDVVEETAIAAPDVAEETIEQLNIRAQKERGLLQEAQAAHARSLRLDQLARQDPAVAELRIDLAKALARIAELESPEAPKL